MSETEPNAATRLIRSGVDVFAARPPRHKQERKASRFASSTRATRVVVAGLTGVGALVVGVPTIKGALGGAAEGADNVKKSGALDDLNPLKDKKISVEDKGADLEDPASTETSKATTATSAARKRGSAATAAATTVATTAAPAAAPAAAAGSVTATAQDGGTCAGEVYTIQDTDEDRKGPGAITVRLTPALSGHIWGPNGVMEQCFGELNKGNDNPPMKPTDDIVIPTQYQP